MFKALADPTRRRLLDALNIRNGQTLRDLCAGMGMTRQSVSKHIAVLEVANVITTIRRGREKLHYLNAAPIKTIADRWINQYDGERVHALAELQRVLEQEPMGKPEFIYTTYIKTTPERLWQALTDSAFTRRYWGVAFDTDWQVGSTMTWEEGGNVTADPEQVVLEYEPYRRLSYNWHKVTPEWAKAVGISNDVYDKVVDESRSRATFEIEPLGEMTKLTVVHDNFDEGSVMYDLLSQGWPGLLSSLKTLLETGEPLPQPETAGQGG